MWSMPTPSYSLSAVQRECVYDPAEDTFLLLDALERDREKLRASRPLIVVEIGCGSGVVSTFAAQALGYRVCSLATDLNWHALECTRQTSRMNGVSMDVVRMDLLSAFSGLEGKIDLLLFNPPYVPTEEEAASDLERCWAGGVTGRSALDRLLPRLPALLSPTGVFYVVALHSNDIPHLISHNPEQLKGEIVMQRRCGIEHLYILKFSRV